MKHLTFALLLIFLFSNCKEDRINSDFEEGPYQEVIDQALLKVQNRLSEAFPDEEGAFFRSILFKASKKAFGLAYEKENYTEVSDSLTIRVFRAQEKFVFIRSRPLGYDTSIGLYRVDNSEIKPLFEEDWVYGYHRDTLRDINGDGYQDILSWHYTPSGCCRRNLAKVRLFNLESNSFEAPINFMNPTFFPNEKLVLGVPYGHSGEVPLYKDKWNNLSSETIEYIYPIKELPGKYVRVSEAIPYEKRLDLINHEPKLNSLPKEYEEVEDLDWFLLYQEKDKNP
ncbi:MAG: hypothetical protein AAF696_03800 [Bacteroidota bacterium]